MDTASTSHDGGRTETDPGARDQARSRLQARRDFTSHLAAYVVVNAALVVVWAMTGGGYFWPAWVLAMWGAGLVLHVWETYLHQPITEANIDAELTNRR